jgi:hypothetical protein
MRDVALRRGRILHGVRAASTPRLGTVLRQLESLDMNRIGIGLSFLSALSALIAARYWREASQVYGRIDRLWLDRSGDIPDFVWATAALGAIKQTGDLNRKGAAWAAISAFVSFVAATTSLW